MRSRAYPYAPEGWTAWYKARLDDMKLKLITVAYEPERGTFPDDPLSGIDGEVLSVVEHFFHFEGIPRLLLIVHYSPAEAGTASKRRPDPRDELSDEEKVVFERLRAWRKSRAEADGVPVYVLFSNRQLADIAHQRPTTKAELQSIEGLGEGKSERYGSGLLAALELPRSDASEHSRAK